MAYDTDLEEILEKQELTLITSGMPKGGMENESICLI